MDHEQPASNAFGARPNRRASTQLTIDQEGRKPLFSKPSREGLGHRDTAQAASGANRYGFSPTNARPPSRAAIPRPPSSASQARPPSRAAIPRPSSSASQTPSMGSNQSAETISPNSRIPRPKSTIGIFAKGTVPSVKDAWERAVADDDRLHPLDRIRPSPGAIDASPSPAPRTYVNRQVSDEARVRQTLGKDAVDYSRPRPHSRLSNDSLRDSYVARYGGSPGSQQSGSSSGSFDRRLSQYEREMAQQSPSAGRQTENLFGSSRIGPKIAETGQTLARKTSNSSLNGGQSLGRRASNSSLNSGHSLGRRTSYGSLGGSPRPSAFAKSQVPEGWIKHLLEQDEKGVKRTSMSKPDWETEANTPLPSIETSNAPLEPTPPTSRPASTNPETRSPEKSYAWQLDADFTAGDLQVSDSPRIRIGGTGFDDASNRRLSTGSAYADNQPISADPDLERLFGWDTSPAPNTSRAARSNTKIDEIRQREEKANDQLAELRRSQSRSRNTRLEEIREKEAEAEEEMARTQPRSYYPTPDDLPIREEDDTEEDVKTAMKEPPRQKNTKLDEIRAREAESLSKRAMASSRLEEIREQNSMSRSMSPEARRNSEIARESTPAWEINGGPRHPAEEGGEHVPNTPITIYRKADAAKENEAQAETKEGYRKQLASPESPVRPDFAHTRTDSRDLLQRLARATSSSPASETQAQPANVGKSDQENFDKRSDERARQREERAKQREEERTKRREEERAKKLEEEKARQLEEDRAKQLEEERAKKLEEERSKKLEEERAQQLEEERIKKLEEERVKKFEEERAKTLEEERVKKLEEERAKQREEERQAEEERAKKREEERSKQRAERVKQLQEERAKQREEEKARQEKAKRETEVPEKHERQETAAEDPVKKSTIPRRKSEDEPKASDTERPKSAGLRRERRQRSTDSAKDSRKSVAMSDGDPTDRIEQEMKLFAPADNQSERGSVRAPSAEPSVDDEDKDLLADETPRPVKVDPLSLPTPKVTGAYVETPATVKVARVHDDDARPVSRSENRPFPTVYSRPSSSRRSSRASRPASKAGDSDSDTSDQKEKGKEVAGTTTTSTLRRRKSATRSRRPLMNSVKPPTVKDDLMELHRIHQIEDSTTDDLELFQLQALQDPASPDIESMLHEISLQREEVATKSDITEDERENELERIDRMSKSLSSSLNNIRSAKMGIERLGDQIAEKTEEDKARHELREKTRNQLKDQYLKDMAEIEARDRKAIEEHAERLAAIRNRTAEKSTVDKIHAESKEEGRKAAKQHHEHQATDHAHDCPDCMRRAPSKEVKVSYIHLAVPSLYQRNPFRVTFLGILVLLLSAWYAAESAMCELYCRPTTCSSTPCVWSSTDPTWGVALPVKLDEWATNGWGRQVANQLSEEASDLWADAVDLATGTDITTIDISTLDFYGKRQHRRRLRKKGLAKRSAEPAAEHKGKWDAWHAVRVASERARDAREMGYELSEEDESMGGDEAL